MVFFSIKDMLGTSKKLLTRKGEKKANFTPKIKEDNRFLFHFLNGICFILITSSISLLPYCPPNASWDHSPPFLLALTSSSPNPTAQQVSSVFWHSKVIVCEFQEHGPKLGSDFAVCNARIGDCWSHLSHCRENLRILFVGPSSSTLLA